MKNTMKLELNTPLRCVLLVLPFLVTGCTLRREVYRSGPVTVVTEPATLTKPVTPIPAGKVVGNATPDKKKSRE